MHVANGAAVEPQPNTPEEQKSPSVEPAYTALPVSAIRPSPTNPRDSFDQAALMDLAKSIRRHGVLQPITVRTMEDGSYEIITGERRWRASQLAPLAEIPCLIRDDLSPDEVRAIQWVENLMRQDLTPIEEAEGYLKLTQELDVSVEDVALKVGKSTGHIYRMIVLAELPKTLKAAVADGTVKPTTALLFARIRDSKLRSTAVKHFFDAKARDLTASHMEIARQLIQAATLDLGKAPFDPRDAELLPKAGACSLCPKRSQNAPDLFGDAPGNLCTDPACYQSKLTALWEIRKQEVLKEGRKVMAEKEASGLFNPHEPGRLTYEAKRQWIDLDEDTYEGGSRQSWRKLLGKHCPSPILARAPDGSIHELLDKTSTLEWAVQQGFKWAQPVSPSRHRLSEKEREDRRKTLQKEQARKVQLWQNVYALSLHMDNPNEIWESAEFWRLLFAVLRSKSYSDETRLLVNARGWKEKGVFPGEALDKNVKKLTEAKDLRQLFWQLLFLTNSAFSQSTNPRVTEFLRLFPSKTDENGGAKDKTRSSRTRPKKRGKAKAQKPSATPPATQDTAT